MIINHNISALRNLNDVKNQSRKTSLNIEKLSSGLRINKAADDAAGLAISEKMRGQIRGLEQAKRNTQDAISLIQTADGGLSQIIDPPLQRLRELAIQAANGTLNTDDRQKIQDEIEQIKDSIDSIVRETKFNGISLLSIGSTDLVKVISNTNSFGGTRVELSTSVGRTPEQTAENLIQNFQKLKNGEIGNGDTMSIAQHWTLSQPTPNQIKLTNNSGYGHALVINSPDGDIVYSGAWSSSYTITRVPNSTNEDHFGAIQIVDNSDPSDKRDDLLFSFFSHNTTSLTLQVGVNANNDFTIDINDISRSSLGMDDITVLTSTDAQEAINIVDSALEMVLKERSKFGSYQNRLEHTINNLNTYSENLIIAESRIRDIDMAKEIMNQTKNTVLSQAAQAMLAQSNQMPQGVLQLLR